MDEGKDGRRDGMKSEGPDKQFAFAFSAVVVRREEHWRYRLTLGGARSSFVGGGG